MWAPSRDRGTRPRTRPTRRRSSSPTPSRRSRSPAVTPTLAGITGFILSVGMAVDANVLIFERFKEEVRAGRTIPAAVDAAVRRAWPAIRDSNTSTLITCVILGFVGPAQVKGFAIVLGLGVIASLISSLIVTHNLLAIVLASTRFRRPALLGVDRARPI